MPGPLRFAKIMSLPFLIIQLRPEHATADNELTAIKRYGQLADQEIVRIRAEQGGIPAFNLDNYSGIIVGGSPFDISTPSKLKTPMQRKVETDFFHLFDKLVARDFPFLGCCSGNGLLGSYCGATISDKYREGVGGIDISITSVGKQDPLLAGFADSIRVLVGHKEACDELPPECTLLATSASCPVQMFRLQRNMYATQFHPEGDAEGFAVRINIYKHHGYFDPGTAASLIEAIKQEHTPHAQTILKRFVQRYRINP